MNFLFKVLFINFCFTSFELYDCTKIHEFLTKHEIQSIFNSKPESIPDYEIVPIFYEKASHHDRKKRSSTTKLHLKAFKKDIILYLEPTDHVLLGSDTPVYGAEEDDFEPSGVKYTRLQNIWPSDFRTYQDPNNEAAVTIDSNANGQMSIDGIIGNMLIKPLPSRVHKKFPNHFPITSSGFKNKPKFFNNSEKAMPHVVFKRNDNPIIQTIDAIKRTGQTIWNNLFNFGQSSNRHVRSVFDAVYPEILIMVDYETYKMHGKDAKALAKYMAAFWNGVDLKYRSMDDPKVRLNIAGLVISKDENAAPYMKYYEETRMIEDEKTLRAIGKYMYNERRFFPEMFDITVVFTSLDMCMLDSPSFCNSSPKGLAWYGGACKHKFYYADTSVALLKDSGGFDGIATAAHEIGHLLGAPHDGEESPNYIGGPGAKDCDWNDGYLMSSTRRNSKGLQWSPCSIKAMSYFLKKEAHCLRNKPIMLKPLPKLLPGRILSRDEQCKKITKTAECKDRKRECGILWCVNPYNSLNCIITGSPAEGSQCDHHGVCLNGFCTSISVDSTVILEYS